MPWYAVLFWLWLVASMVVFVVRRVRGAQERRLRRAAAAATAPRVWATEPAPPEQVVPTPVAMSAEPAANLSTGRVAPATTATATSLPTIAQIRSMQQRTVLSVLEGIQFPCDLYPLTAETGDLAVARRVLAATTGHGAAEVRAALVAELGRLGFEVQDPAPHQLVATGPRGALAVTLHPSGSPFASAPENAVVVELAVV